MLQPAAVGGRGEMGSAAAGGVRRRGSLGMPRCASGMGLAASGMSGTAGLVSLGRRQLRKVVIGGFGRDRLDGTPA